MSREFCADCGERLDPDAEGACGECGWIPSHYDGDESPDVPSRRVWFGTEGPTEWATPPCPWCKGTGLTDSPAGGETECDFCDGTSVEKGLTAE